MNFKNHLKKQLGFLQRSCNSYDEGFHDEAIRIATVLRVLIHNTRSSTSLLKHLNATTKLSRRKIILAAANKDGGAHVDKKLTPDYANLAKEGAVGTFGYTSNGKESKTAIQDAHLVALRQMAHEVHSSPKLLAI